MPLGKVWIPYTPPQLWVPLLFFHKNDFGIKYPAIVDMLFQRHYCGENFNGIIAEKICYFNGIIAEKIFFHSLNHLHPLLNYCKEFEVSSPILVSEQLAVWPSTFIINIYFIYE